MMITVNILLSIVSFLAIPSIVGFVVFRKRIVSEAAIRTIAFLSSAAVGIVLFCICYPVQNGNDGSRYIISSTLFWGFISSILMKKYANKVYSKGNASIDGKQFNFDDSDYIVEPGSPELGKSSDHPIYTISIDDYIRRLATSDGRKLTWRYRDTIKSVNKNFHKPVKLHMIDFMLDGELYGTLFFCNHGITKRCKWYPEGYSFLKH